ncbi:MAG: Maf family nucleotide pyrophosphatase [Muribaculaceae bacterium]|nr:Maf family nucleotide pyrophosphatase [Muribaculaceae bacterium]
MLENLEKYHILLASKSPRRRELLSNLRIPFNSISMGGIDESYPENMPVNSVPQYLAAKKADAYSESIRTNEMIITADTLVIKGEKVYSKPKNNQEAKEMLRELSGNIHKVITGVCIYTLERQACFTSETDVKFAELSDEDIDYYVENYIPLDKAGAYGIQEWIGCVAVEWIRGSFYNVMGLPVHKLYQELKKF